MVAPRRLLALLLLAPLGTVLQSDASNQNQQALVARCDSEDAAIVRSACDELASTEDLGVIPLPERPRVYVRLADALVRRARSADAVALLRIAARMFPRDADVLLGVARLHADSCVEALGALLQTIRYRPDSFEALEMLGRCEYELDRNAEALDAYERALRLNATSPVAIVGYARALVMANKAQEALQRLKEGGEAIRRGGAFEQGEAVLVEGNALLRLRRYDQSASAYGRAIDGFPAQRDLAYCGLAKALHGMKRDDEARDVCGKARAKLGTRCECIH